MGETEQEGQIYKRIIQHNKQSRKTATTPPNTDMHNSPTLNRRSNKRGRRNTKQKTMNHQINMHNRKEKLNHGPEKKMHNNKSKTFIRTEIPKLSRKQKHKLEVKMEQIDHKNEEETKQTEEAK